MGARPGRRPSSSKRLQRKLPGNSGEQRRSTRGRNGRLRSIVTPSGLGSSDFVPSTRRLCRLQNPGCGGDNRYMPNNSQRDDKGAPAQTPALDPFVHGSMVVVTLGNPRDKFWGMILSLAPEGLSLSGIELASFEDLVVMVKDGEPFSPAVVFFPMHRIERVELDLPDGSLPSLSQRFSAKTGLHPTALLESPGTGDRGASVRPPVLSKKEPA